ncbi:MAG: precorrin-3B C(17)-methyltransferase [Rhizobiaceae bacterium]
MIAKPVIVILTASAFPLAEKLAAFTGAEVHSLARRVSDTEVTFDDAGLHLASLFGDRRTIIGIMAAGALIRLLAPMLANKRTDPPVLAVAEDASCVVPLLGGHHGANQMARALAEYLGGVAAITSAGDIRFGVALDDPPDGWILANPDAAKPVMAELLNGATAQIDGDLVERADWITESGIEIAEGGPIRLTFANEAVSPAPLQLVYNRPDCVMGLGCERGADADEVIALAETALKSSNISHDALAMIATIDIKADEAAINAAAAHFNVPMRLFNAEVLEIQTPRLANPSDIVFAEVGCHGVAEAAALSATGDDGQLIVEKHKSKRATAAIAQAPNVIDPKDIGRSRGQLSVVGIGPGSDDWRSPEVSELISQATDLVGYSLYLDLVGPLASNKTRHDFDLGKEEDRVRHAMKLAGEGKHVALVCSGDAGIYAMATLVFELLESGGLCDAAQRIAIQVSPGISALQAAAARAGAPLGHDFCTISLSDLLTSWEIIQKRVEAAAESDFVIAFYNPVSKRRRTQLADARDVLLKHRPVDTPVIVATNLGRDGETLRVVPLGELDVDDVDMLTVVIIGSSQTRTVSTGSGTTWVYTPRGYAAKPGTKIGSTA